MTGLVLRPVEVQLLLASGDGTFTIYRAVNRKHPPTTLDVATIAAMKALNKEWGVGRQFYTKELFIQRFFGDRNETEVRFHVDRELIPPGIIKGRVGDLPRDGVYPATLQRPWMARTKVEIVSAEVELGTYHHCDYAHPRKGYVWAVALKRIPLR